MVDFTLTDEQSAIRELAREFAEQEIMPVALERDREPDPLKRLNEDILEKGDKVGFRTLLLSKEWGGPESTVDTLSVCLLTEELARGDLGMCAVILGPAVMAKWIQDVCTDEQRQRFLVHFRDDPVYTLANAITEPNFAGSNLMMPFYEGCRLGTAATLDGDEWVINGSKISRPTAHWRSSS